jgi:hypothetical protein
MRRFCDFIRLLAGDERQRAADWQVDASPPRRPCTSSLAHQCRTETKSPMLPSAEGAVACSAGLGSARRPKVHHHRTSTARNNTLNKL